MGSDNFSRVRELVNGQVKGEKIVGHCPCHEDKTPSFECRRSETGHLLFHCWSGCDGEALVAYFKEQGVDATPSKTKEPLPEWRYTDDAGRFIFSKKRFVRKDGKKGYYIDPKDYTGPQFLLYAVKLNQAIDAKKTICITEGEKDADTLNASLPDTYFATTNKVSLEWCEDFTRVLTGCNLVIFEDNDSTGRKRTRMLCKFLLPVASSVRIIRFTDLPTKSDVTDYLSSGASSTDLLDRIEKALDVKAAPKLEEFSDYGNSLRFVKHFGEVTKFVSSWKSFAAWDGTRWSRNNQVATGYAIKTALLIDKEAMQAANAQEVIDWGLTSRNSGKLASMLTCVKAHPDIQAEAEDFDTHNHLLTCSNGTLDLNTFELRQCETEDMITCVVPTRYVPNAKAPLFYKFINRIFDEDEETIAFVQRAFGYSLTGEMGERSLFVCWGESGTNGKSTLLNVIERVLGGDYCMKLRTETIMETKRSSSGANNDIAALKGKRFTWCSEPSQFDKLNQNLVKELTGAESLTARFLHEEFFTFTPQFKVWLATNAKPEIKDGDKAIWNRIKLIPFVVEIPKEDVDTTLPAKLYEEREGILAWLVEGCKMWRSHGLGSCAAVDEAVEEYQRENSSIGRFIEEKMERAIGLSVAVSAVYDSYKVWAMKNGERALSLTKFSPLAVRAGLPRPEKLDQTRRKCFANWQLIGEEEDEYAPPEEKPTYGMWP